MPWISKKEYREFKEAWDIRHAQAMTALRGKPQVDTNPPEPFVVEMGGAKGRAKFYESHPDLEIVAGESGVVVRSYSDGRLRQSCLRNGYYSWQAAASRYWVRIHGKIIDVHESEVRVTEAPKRKAKR